MKDFVYGIFGNVGGGTSAIAGVVHILGIPMNGHYRTIDDNVLYSSRPDFNVIDARTGTWGFKHPCLTDYIQSLAEKIPNLRPIYVFRDPVAAAWRSDTKLNTVAMFDEHMKRQHAMLDGPAGLYLSYERAIRSPEKTVDQLAAYIHLSPTNQQKQKAVAWLDPTLGYRRIADYL